MENPNYDLTRTSHILMKAADVIRDRGWVRGTWEGDYLTGGVCLEGALLAAQGLHWGGSLHPDTFRSCNAYRAVHEFLTSRGEPVLYGDLWWWNDRKAESADEVIEMLRAAAIVELCKEKNIQLDLRDAVNEALADAPRMGNIGEPTRHIEFEPFPAEAPAEPVREPEKVPA